MTFCSRTSWIRSSRPTIGATVSFFAIAETFQVCPDCVFYVELTAALFPRSPTGASLAQLQSNRADRGVSLRRACAAGTGACALLGSPGTAARSLPLD